MPRRRTPRSVREQRVAEQVAAERAEELKTKTLALRSGDKISIEEDAEKLLASGRRNSESSDKTDYLSREQLILRRNKEVYNSNGVPDSSLVSGIYKRVYNPEFGSRPGKGRAASDD
jgi:hypothetical protein